MKIPLEFGPRGPGKTVEEQNGELGWASQAWAGTLPSDSLLDFSSWRSTRPSTKER